MVDLLRVRLTWPVPGDNNAKITAYTIKYCHILNPTMCVASEPRTLPANDTDVLTTNQGTVSYVLQHGASLDTRIRVTITATNSVGEGGTLNGPSDVPVATTGKCVCVCTCLCMYVCLCVRMDISLHAILVVILFMMIQGV